MQQSTSTVFMVQPVAFDHNTQTSTTNAFQKTKLYEESLIQKKALEEFNTLVEQLKHHGIEVVVFEDTIQPHKPDSIFPNNWITIHPKAISLYPMFAENRRLERRSDVVNFFKDRYHIPSLRDYSIYETQGQIVEGTGSMVFDHLNKTVYMCTSSRADQGLLYKIAEDMGYDCINFEALDHQGKAIYHTNVMLCIGTGFAVICLESITNPQKKDFIVHELERGGRELVEISMEQLYHFAGNMLELENPEGQKFVAMSTQAYESLNAFQIYQLEKYVTIIHSPIPTIEYHGGGSVRCMLAEVFF